MLSLRQIKEAQAGLAGTLTPTPLFPCEALGKKLGRTVLLKAENLQQTGSFKIRGATCRLQHLTEEQRLKGVVAASAGNHAQGVALAAARRKIPATIFMPQDSPLIKVRATQAQGARIELLEGGLEECLAGARRLQKEAGCTFIHPFDDAWIQAGQGSVGLEILEAVPDVAGIVVPVGGGGLIAGIAVAVREQAPGVKIFGVQAQGADPAARSLAAGRPVRLDQAATLADGIRVREVAASTFEIMQEHVERIVTVPDEALSQAMVFLLETAKLVVEGAGAAGLAACQGEFLQETQLPAGPLVIVLSGGNADINLLSRVIQQGLTAAGRYVLLRTRIPDRPGHLKTLLDTVATLRANIVEITHHRSAWRVPLGDVEVEMLLETRHPGHGLEILAALQTRSLEACLVE